MTPDCLHIFRKSSISLAVIVETLHITTLRETLHNYIKITMPNLFTISNFLIFKKYVSNLAS